MSYNRTAKANQKVHRERGQLSNRSHLGQLEKKKDYILRAEDHNKKQKTIKALRQQALNKNPDEFYFKMVRTRMEDGVHQTEDTVPQYTDEQLKLMQTQDIKYVNYKCSTESKKIKRLKSHLHLLDVKEGPRNKHTVFVDSKKEAKTFDAAKYLDTHPALVGRAYNRPRSSALRSGSLAGGADDDTLARVALTRDRQYKELGQRIEREKQLQITSQKLAMKRHLVDKKSRKKEVQKESVDSAAQYKWAPCRKR